MSLLKKLNIDSSAQNVSHEDVDVPELGEDAKIRVQKLRIAGQIRLSELHKLIEDMKLKDKNQVNMLNITAMLMCVMVDEEGEYLVPENEILATMNTLDSAGVFFTLFSANNRVNAVNVEEVDENLDKAKKNS